MAKAMTEETEYQAKENAQSLGQYLREARLKLALGLDDVSRDTRIPERYLGALEDDNYDDLPGAAYAGGFLRGYARQLGLDENEILARYRTEIRLEKPSYNFSLQEPPAESRLPSRGMVIGGLVVAIMAYGTWFSIHSKPVDVAVSPVAPEQVVTQTSQSVDHREELESFAPGAQGEEEDPQSYAEDQLGSSSEAADEIEISEAEDKEDAPAPAPVETVDAMVVEAIEDSWIHVTQGEDILYSGIMKAGNSFTAQGKEGAELTTGNAGGVLLRLGDWNSGPLGPTGRVRRGVSLNPVDWDGAQRSSDHS